MRLVDLFEIEQPPKKRLFSHADEPEAPEAPFNYDNNESVAWRSGYQSVLDKSITTIPKIEDAPLWYDNNESWAWKAGVETALEDLEKDMKIN